jgi:Rps23 Pro-64 3,4-dihydroxylase Tpa1-like proline 4-hydroxylase
MDLRSFFQKGYTSTSLSKDTSDAVLARMPSSFSAPDAVLTEKEHPIYHADSGLFYCECTTSGTAVNPPLAARKMDASSSEFFSVFWDQLAKEKLSWFNQSLGCFSRFSKQFHSFRKDDYLKFHFDFKDAIPVIAILYLGDSDFTYQDGGYLEIGRCSLTEDFEINHDSIEKMGTVLPNHGNLVFINNLSPFFVHAVAPLRIQKRRFSAICQFGYSENELYSLQARGWIIQ